MWPLCGWKRDFDTGFEPVSGICVCSNGTLEYLVFVLNNFLLQYLLSKTTSFLIKAFKQNLD